MNTAEANSSIGPDSYSQLIEDIQDFAIFLLDAEGHVKTWNSGAERLFGFTEDEMMGEDFSRLFLRDDVNSGVPKHELRSAAQTGRVADNRWLVRKDGRRIWVEGCLVAINGSISCGFGKIVRNQTSAKEDKEHIDQLNAQLHNTVNTLQTAQVALQEKINELEQFADAVVGRELKMMAYEKERASLIAENQRLRIALNSQNNTEQR